MRLGFTHLLQAFSIVLLLTGGCTKRYEANAAWEVELSGICTACPASRIDTLVSRLDGIISTHFNSQKQVLTIRYDSTGVTPVAIVAVLNDAGYDVGDSPSLMPSLLDACCVRSLDDLGSLLNPSDTIGLTQAQKAALLDSLRDTYLSGADDIERMLDDELGDINLDDVLRDDLLANPDDLAGESDLMPDLPNDINFDATDDAEMIGGIEQTENQPSRPAPRQPAKRQTPKPSSSRN